MLLRQSQSNQSPRITRQRKISIESLETRQMLSVDGLAYLGGDDQIVLEETVPVNVVFIGFEESEIDVDQFLDSLPSEQVPIVRAREFWYGMIDKVGLHYDYDYDCDVTFASQQFEDAFFGEMSRIAQPREAITLPQQFYNDRLRMRLTRGSKRVTSVHPTTPVLHAFARGELEDPRFEEVAIHLEMCEASGKVLADTDVFPFFTGQGTI